MIFESKTSGDRRAFLGAGGAALAAIVLPPLSAQERASAQPTVARSEFDDVKDFVQALGRVTVITRDLDERIGRAPRSQQEKWKGLRNSIRETISGAEDQVVALIRSDFTGQAKRADDFSGQMGQRTAALREVQADLEIIMKQAGSKITRALPGEGRPNLDEPKPRPRPASPLIVIANPFEEVLARQGFYDTFANLAKQGIDSMMLKTGGDGGFFAAKRDWQWRLETKRFTRPQDVEAERAYEAMRNGLVKLAAIDALVKMADVQPGRARDPEWQAAKSRVHDRLVSSEQKIREGFEACLKRASRQEGLQMLKESTSRIGLAYGVVESFLK